MASRSKRQRRRRREIVRQRSIQARENEAARLVPNVRSYDETSLGRFTTEQLRNVAGNLAVDFDNEKKKVEEQARQRFYNVPKITITKRDVMFASRPEITDRQMAEAHPKQRKLLRRQQRRRAEALEKISRANDYNNRLVDRNIRMQRYMEEHGLDVAETGLSQSLIQGTARENGIMRSKNVLKDREFVKGMSRGELIREITDVAEKVGKPAKTERRQKRRYKNVGTARKPKGWQALKGQDAEDFMTYRKLRGAFDPDIAKKYMKLKPGQKSVLHNATNFGSLLAKVVRSPDKYLKRKSKKPVFVFVNDSSSDKGKARRELSDFIDMVKQYD